MLKLRTSAVLAASVAALSWTTASRADDTKHGTQSSPDTTTITTVEESTTMTPAAPDSSGANPWGSAYDTGVPVPAQPITGTTTTTTAASFNDLPGAESSGEWKVRPNRPLLASGAAIFLGTYGASAIVGAVSDTKADDKLFIPLVGPWLDMADRECGFGDCGSREDFNNALLVGSGVAQAAGLGIAIAGLLIPETHKASVLPAAKAEPPKPSVTVAPLNLKAGGGLSAAGTF